MKRRYPLILLLALAPCIAVTAERDDRFAGRSPSVETRAEHRVASRPSTCDRVARSAFQACKNDVQDDYFTWIGNCLYVSDPAEATECRDEAEEVREEETALCEDRFDARRELCEALDEDLYDPDFSPENFVSPDEAAASPNPYFPLVPGNVAVFESDDGETITVTVTDETIEIAGVECRIVRDVVQDEDGEVIEDTGDYYAQDLAGNVWYFGEIAKNFEDGRLTDLDGSWISGEEFAKPGILMHAVPVPGPPYRQEYLLREAEDVGQVLDLAADATTPAADCDGRCLQTLDFTPLEPDVAEHKFYLRGIGPVLEIDLESGDRAELVSFTPGR